MKKKSNSEAWEPYALNKCFKIMKIFLFLMVFSIGQLLAIESYSQKTAISLDFRQSKLVRVLDEIENQSDFYFLFNEQLIDMNRKVDIRVKDQEIGQILSALFSGTGVDFQIVDRKIVLSPKKEDLLQQPRNLLVKGKVEDSNESPLPGVTVAIKGTIHGTITDAYGNYSCQNVPKDAVLIFSFVGMRTQEIALAGRNVINVKLVEETIGVDEVVVVGYGTQKKVNLTGSVSSVNITKIAETRPVTNLSSGLAGLAPGLYVQSANNDPGSNAILRIRGQGTLNNSSPLIIIDGAEGDISRLSPNDIESISVLKDAASAAIYGSRAANGVILITTKQGKEGKISINYNGYLSSQSASNLIPLVDNSVEYMELINEAARNSKQAQVFSDANIQLWKDNEGGDPLLWPNSNWNDAVFKSALVINHNVSASGGTEKLKSFFSFDYADTPGIVDNTGFTRYGIRQNSQLQVNSWLNVGMNINGTYSEKERGSSILDGMFTNSILSVPTVVIRHPDGRYGGTNNVEDNTVARSPLVYLNSIKGDNKTNMFFGKFYANINPFNGFTINSSYNHTFYTNKLTTIPVQIDTWNFQTNTILSPGSGTQLYVTNSETRYTRSLMDATALYERTFLNNLDFSLLAGASQEQYVHETFTAQKQDLVDGNLTQINGATGDATASGTLTDWAMRSFFSRLNLGWAGKYLFEFNFRRDGSSRFAGNNRWGNFASASAAWRISEEIFFKSLKESWFNNLKFRFSYGSLGNNSVGNYDAIPVLSTTQYVLNNSPAVGIYQSAISNANLAWESTTVTNIGLDFGLWQNKLTGSIDLYDKFTHNIIIDLPAPGVHGLATIPKQNSAEVQNRGIEINIGWRDKIDDFEYFFEANATYNQNEVKKFKGDEYSLSGTSMIKEGLSINTDYVLLVDRIVQTEDDLNLVQSMIDNAPLDANNNKMNPFPYGTPLLGDFLYKDTNNDGLVNDNDRVNVGHGPNPRFIYSFSLGASYRGFDASVFIDGISGLKGYFQNTYYTPVLQRTNIVNKEIADGRWYEGRTTPAKYPRVLIGDTRNTRSSDFWLQDRSFLKIRNIQVGYTLPKTIMSKFSVSRFRIYVGLENYFTFTDFKGLDPEVSGVSYPTMKQAVLGVNVSF